MPKGFEIIDHKYADDRVRIYHLLGPPSDTMRTLLHFHCASIEEVRKAPKSATELFHSAVLSMRGSIRF
jgi:hypothetical protein